MGMEEHEEIDAIVPIDETMEASEEAGIDVNLSDFEQTGEGEPSESEVNALTDTAIQAIQEVDAYAEPIGDNLINHIHGLSDAFAEKLGTSLPQSSQEALAVLRNDAAEGMKNLRDLPAKVLIGLIEMNEENPPVQTWYEEVRENPLSALPPVGIPMTVHKTLFPDNEGA